MSVEVVEKILIQLSDDDSFRSRVFADPSAELDKFDLTAEEHDLLYRMVFALRAKSAESQEYIRVNYIDKLLKDRAARFTAEQRRKPSLRCIGDGSSMKYYVV